eukprot:425471-Pyramimonas_sp.AAC.1
MGCGAPGSKRRLTCKGVPGSTSSRTPGETRHSCATTSSMHGAKWDTTPKQSTASTSSTPTGQTSWRSSASTRSATVEHSQWSPPSEAEANTCGPKRAK